MEKVEKVVEEEKMTEGEGGQSTPGRDCVATLVSQAVVGSAGKVLPS